MARSTSRWEMLRGHGRRPELACSLAQTDITARLESGTPPCSEGAGQLPAISRELKCSVPFTESRAHASVPSTRQQGHICMPAGTEAVQGGGKQTFSLLCTRVHYGGPQNYFGAPFLSGWLGLARAHAHEGALGEGDLPEPLHSLLTSLLLVQQLLLPSDVTAVALARDVLPERRDVLTGDDLSADARLDGDLGGRETRGEACPSGQRPAPQKLPRKRIDRPGAP
jgi:hypothetical protein